MRIITKKLANRKLYFEKFDSYKEFIKIVKERDGKVNREYNLNINANPCNFNETGVRSYEEAESLLLNGWDKEVENLKSMIDKEINLCDNKKVIRQFSDIAGFMPIVPNVIMGLPNSMINVRSDFKKQKVIKFLVCINRRYSYSSQQIIEKMSKLFARIAVLEKNGYRCRIEVFASQSCEYSKQTLVAHTILIKSENQLLDVKRVCFPLIHSAMQRVFSWGWENSLPINYDEYHEYGLGSAIQYWSENKRNELLDAIKEKNDKIILVGMESDLDEVFGKEVKM